MISVDQWKSIHFNRGAKSAEVIITSIAKDGVNEGKARTRGVKPGEVMLFELT